MQTALLIACAMAGKVNQDQVVFTGQVEHVEDGVKDVMVSGTFEPNNFVKEPNIRIAEDVGQTVHILVGST